MSKNKVFLIGYVGQDPEIKYINPDTPVANFSLATSESYKNKEGERVENTQWHKCVAWRGLATLCEKYVNKGSFLAVEGKIEYRIFDDNNGKRYYTDIIVNDITFLGKSENKDSNTKQQYSEPAPTDNYSVSADDDEVDDLPF